MQWVCNGFAMGLERFCNAMALQCTCNGLAMILQWICNAAALQRFCVGSAALTQHSGVLHEQHEAVAQSGADGFCARKEEVEGRQLQVLHGELRVGVVLLLGAERGRRGLEKGAELLWGLQWVCNEWVCNGFVVGLQWAAKAMVAELFWGLQEVKSCFVVCKGTELWGLQKVRSHVGICKVNVCRIALSLHNADGAALLRDTQTNAGLGGDQSSERANKRHAGVTSPRRVWGATNKWGAGGGGGVQRDACRRERGCVGGCRSKSQSVQEKRCMHTKRGCRSKRRKRKLQFVSIEMRAA